MTEPRRSLSLKELGDRVRQAQHRQDPGGSGGRFGNAPRSSLGWAFRIGVDLVSALVVGVGIGWFLDHTFGTMPLFLVLFFFLGAAAGALNVWRLVTRMGMMSGPAPEAAKDRGPEKPPGPEGRG